MVIQALVESQYLDSMTAFFSTTRDTDNPAAFNFADLPDRCPNRPGRRSHHQRFTGFWLTDIQQAHIGGKARHPEHAKCP